MSHRCRHHGAAYVVSPYSLCLQWSELWWLALNAGAATMLAGLALVLQWAAARHGGPSPQPASGFTRCKADATVTADGGATAGPAAAANPAAVPPPAARGPAAAVAGLLVRRGYTWGQVAAVVLWACWSVVSLAVPLAHLTDLDSPYWLKDAPDGAPPPTRAALWAYAVGAKSAWPALGNFFLCMMTVSRTAPVLDLLGAKAEDVVWFHKLTARAAIFWVAVHGECRHACVSRGQASRARPALLAWLPA